MELFLYVVGGLGLAVVSGLIFVKLLESDEDLGTMSEEWRRTRGLGRRGGGV